MSTPLLEVKDLTKSFSGVMALNGVKLTVGKGEVHALLVKTVQENRPY